MNSYSTIPRNSKYTLINLGTYAWLTDYLTLILSKLPSGPKQYELKYFGFNLLNKVPIKAGAGKIILESRPTTSSFSVCDGFVYAKRAGKYSSTPPPRCGDSTTRSFSSTNPTSESRHPLIMLVVVKLPYLQSYVVTRPSESVPTITDPSGET